MATQNVRLTPHTDQTPAVVEVTRELSGAQWCARFPGSAEVSQLRPSFQLPVSNFIWAMEQAGAAVKVNATYRPKERAYLMLWSWMIFKELIDPAQVPSRDGVLIEWVHATPAASRAAATDMANRYAIAGLMTRPGGEESLHCIREAIDMSISWSGALSVVGADDQAQVISSLPRNGTNAELAELGAAYGVIKFIGRGDPPHWSTTGR
jgi:hypothetical protein